MRSKAQTGMAKRALQVATARQVLLGECYLADADGKTGKSDATSGFQEEAIVLNF